MFVEVSLKYPCRYFLLLPTCIRLTSQHWLSAKV